MGENAVEARMLKDRAAYGRKFKKDDIVKVYVLKDGRARIVAAMSVLLMPSEYQLVIDDAEFDRLLNQGHGDVV